MGRYNWVTAFSPDVGRSVRIRPVREPFANTNGHVICGDTSLASCLFCLAIRRAKPNLQKTTLEHGIDYGTKNTKRQIFLANSLVLSCSFLAKMSCFGPKHSKRSLCIDFPCAGQSEGKKRLAAASPSGVRQRHAEFTRNERKILGLCTKIPAKLSLSPTASRTQPRLGIGLWRVSHRGCELTIFKALGTASGMRTLISPVHILSHRRQRLRADMMFDAFRIRFGIRAGYAQLQ